MPKVSILVPIFNVENYLRECLDSIAAQTLKDIEIICINDGSTDASLAIIQEYVARDRRFNVIDKQNSGYGDSMNQGLRLASGEFIGIVESDDWAEPEMFEELYDLAVKNHAEVVKTEFYSYFTDPAKVALNSKKSQLILDHEVDRVLNPKFNQHIFYQQPSIWSAIYNRKFLQENDIDFLPTPGASYQDTAFNFKVWASASRVYFTREAYLHYRLDSDGSSVNNPGKVFCVADEYDEIERFLRSRGADQILLNLMRACRWGGYRWNIERLAPDLAGEFILRASAQYRAEFEAGDFQFENCDVNFTRGIEELIHDPDMLIKRRYARDTAKVSVVFPVYNVEDYVEDSLKSLLAQSLNEVQIVVVDDGSTDGSMDIVEQFYKDEPRMTIIFQHNQGLSVARNTGIDAASGEYIAFLDSDDTFDVDALARLYSAATEHSAELVCGSSRVKFEIQNRTAAEKLSDRRYVRNKHRGEHAVSPEILEELDVHVWNKLFLASSVKNNNIQFPPNLKYEDAYFLNVFAWSSSRCYFLDPEQPIHTYLRRPGAIMSETFSGGQSAEDHLNIAFLLFDEVMKSRNRAQFGAYYVMLLDRYIFFALMHTSLSGHEAVWRRARNFVMKHSRELHDLNPERYADLESRVIPSSIRALNRFPRAQMTVMRAGARAKSVLANAFTSVSANRRLQKKNLSEIVEVNRTLRAGFNTQATQISRLTKRIEELDPNALGPDSAIERGE